MSRLQAVVCAAAFALTVPGVSAQTKDEHQAHHPDANVTTAPETDTKGEGEMGMMKSMQDGMKKMKELMEKLQATTDPEEKAKLLKQHMQAMREQMEKMRGMGGGMRMGMMDGGMGQGSKKAGGGMGMKMCGGKKGMKSGDMMMKCHRMMQARMDMMQEMMGQMLEHEDAEQKLEHGE
jgi:hypothetical protein